MQVFMINTLEALKYFLQWDVPRFYSPEHPSLFIDLEGNNLSRHGTLSIITIIIKDQSHDVFLIDIHTLGQAAFTTSENGCMTLQNILENENMGKAFFDVRNDSDALFSLYGIRLQGIFDLQLMELGSRSGPRSGSKLLVNGLAKCIERDLQLSKEETQEWKTIKEQGNQLFNPARGGSFAVFDQRPLTEDIRKYCVQDVVHMPALYKVYDQSLTGTWKEKVHQETLARIALSQSAEFVGNGRHMALGPEAWRPGSRG